MSALFWLAFHPSVRLYRWAKRGDFSYGIYLYAFPIQQLLVRYVPGLHPLVLFLIATPLSVTVLNMMEKNTATPSVPPTRLVVSLTAEPTPAFAGARASMIDAVEGALVKPSPPPISTICAAISA